jgi:hypothetical protein
LAIVEKEKAKKIKIKVNIFSHEAFGCRLLPEHEV